MKLLTMDMMALEFHPIPPQLFKFIGPMLHREITDQVSKPVWIQIADLIRSPLDWSMYHNL